MTNHFKMTSPGRFALIAGFALLVIAISAPYAEFIVGHKLVVGANPSDIVKNILADDSSFRSGILGYLVTFVCDLLVAWALYVFLKPVSKNLSLIAALFRIVYAIIFLIALFNLVGILKLISTPYQLKNIMPEQVNNLINLSLNAFRDDWTFGLVFFGIHLGLLGYLVLKSAYIPKIMGILLIVAGLGYIMKSLHPYLFANINTDFARYTFYGEVIFMVWLLTRGQNVGTSNEELGISN